jgi:uncharacterized membrane protein YdbT with pleckstrin-like domain
MYERNYLYDRIKIVWMLPVLVALLVAWMLVLLAANMFPQQLSLSSNDYLYGLVITIAVVLASYAYTELKYWNYFYEFTDNGLRISNGIIEKNVHVLPYAKIQHLRAERSIFEAMLGMVHIHIDTAGEVPSQRTPLIPGVPIEAYEELVSFIKNMAYPDQSTEDKPRVFIPAARSQEEMLRLMLEQLILINKRLADANNAAKPPPAAPKPIAKKIAKTFKKEERHLEDLLEDEDIRTHL